MSHTPGPWIFYADLPSTDPNWHIVTTENKLRVLANVHIEPGNVMDLANARLIASAPMLLEALEALRDTVKKSGLMNGREYDSLGIQVNKAIADARGEV